MFFSLLRQRERTKRDHVARSVSDKIMIPRIFAAGLASLKQVLAMPSAPCSIIGFYPFPSRYRNVIRSKDEDYPSFRPPSRNLIRGYSVQIADQVRDEGIKSAMRLYLRSRCSYNCFQRLSFATRQRLSKLNSALAAPIILNYQLQLSRNLAKISIFVQLCK